MPLYRTDTDLLYFAHVPKCAGTSMTEHLSARFGRVAFEDRGHIRDAAPHPWSRTSPQHIDAAALERLLPRAFYDRAFAIVRHPEARLASVFAFQQREQKTINRFKSFSGWLAKLAKNRARNPYMLDNHPRPQVDFLPPDTQVFRLEDGLEPALAWLDQHYGPRPDLPPLGFEKKADKRPDISDVDRRTIRTLYAADYTAFGYGD